MVLKDDRQRVKDLLRETVTMLCKRGLSYNAQLSVEGLLGITLDDDEVFLVNIKETVQNPTSSSPLTTSEQDLEDSMSLSTGDSPLGGESRADIVSRAVTPMHTFRNSSIRGKQRSRKRVWGMETRVSQGDQAKGSSETRRSSDSSPNSAEPPRKQQLADDAASLPHSVVKQEIAESGEHGDCQESQNFDNSFASSVFNVDQPTELSPTGNDDAVQSARCRLPVAIAVEGNQSEEQPPSDVQPGCSSWTESADKMPGPKSHMTVCEDGADPTTTEEVLTNHVGSEDGEANEVLDTSVESDIVIVQPEAPEESGIMTVEPQAPEDCGIVTVQPESPEDSGIVTVHPEAPEESEMHSQAIKKSHVVDAQSNMSNVEEEHAIITALTESRGGLIKGGEASIVPQMSCSMTVQSSPKEIASFAAVQPGASNEISREKNGEQQGAEHNRPLFKQPTNEKFCIEEGEIVSPASKESLTNLGISPEQLAAAGFVLPIPGMTNPLGVNEIALTHLNHGNHTNFNELQQNLLWYTQCMEAAGANIVASNDSSRGEVKNSGLQMLRCRTCGKQLSSARSLMLHENRHQGIYPFHCPICGKGFASNYNMRGHMAHHTNIREFKCHLCAAEYVYKQPLQKHYEKAHGIDVGYTELPIVRPQLLPQ